MADKLKDFHLTETDSILNACYKVERAKFDLIYHKEKDLVIVLKNGSHCGLEAMTPREVDSYKEALEICVCYHHNREDEPLH